MNGALLGLLSNFLGSNDAQKNKDEGRKYNEAQRQLEWQREEDLKRLDKFSKENDQLKAAQYIEKNPVRTNSFDQFQKTGQVAPITADDVKYRPSYVQEAQSLNLRMGVIPIESQARYKEALEQNRAAFIPYVARNPGTTVEQWHGLTGGNAGNASKVEAELIGGRPLSESKVNTDMAQNRASMLSADKAATELESTRPRWGEEAVSGQTLRLQTDKLGGMSPAQSYRQPALVIMNPETGATEVMPNPAASMSNPDTELGTAGLGGDVYDSIAGSLGLQKRPIQFDASGKPATHARPATPTPSASVRPKFSGNLATVEDAPINYGSITPAEAANAQGLVLNKDGSFSAKKTQPREPFAFSQRDSGFSGMANLLNPNSPYNIINRVYGNEGMGLGDAYITGGKRQPTEQEKELLKQRATQIQKYFTR